MRDNVIGPGKQEEFSKSPGECKVKKKAEEAQGKQTGPERPRETNGTQEPANDVTKEPMVVLGH